MFSVTGTSRSRRSTRSPITASPPRRFGLRGHSCCAGCYRRRRLTSSTLAAARACPWFPQSRATGRGDSTFGAPVTPGTPPYPADRVDVAAGTVTHRRRLSRWQGSHRARASRPPACPAALLPPAEAPRTAAHACRASRGRRAQISHSNCASTSAAVWLSKNGNSSASPSMSTMRTMAGS